MLDKSEERLYYIKAVCGQAHMEQYRSGHNGHDWKSCVPQKGTEGSNPSCSARKETPFVYQTNGVSFQLSVPCGTLSASTAREVPAGVSGILNFTLCEAQYFTAASPLLHLGETQTSPKIACCRCL